MKLEKYSKNSKQKKIIIGSIIALILLVGGITLYRTFALYEEKKEFNILKGRVPNFMSADVSLAFVVNDVPSEKVPAKGNYIVDVTCDGGYGEWDYTAWDIVIRSFANGTKCDVTFTSVTEEEMPNISYLKRVKKSTKVTPLTVPDSNTNQQRTVTFDFSEIPGYENLTADNFIANIDTYTAVYQVAAPTRYPQIWSFITSLSYDQKTGKVLVKYLYVSNDHSTVYNSSSNVECTLFYN